jgi:peptide/nickel transport system permease protein
MTKKIALCWLLIWIVAAASSQWISTDFVITQSLCGQSKTMLMGCDAFGRNLLWLVPSASLLSLGFAVSAVTLCCLLGIIAGLTLALAPQKLSGLGLRGLEMTLIFPPILISLSWAAIRGPGWSTLAFSLMMNTFPSVARLMYVRTKELLSEEYLLAAKAIGATPTRIAFHHLLPGLIPVCIVLLPGLFAYSLLAEATLSFLGVGVPIGHDSWGSLLAQGKDYLLEAPLISIATGVPLVLTVLSLQILSEPKSR